MGDGGGDNGLAAVQVQLSYAEEDDCRDRGAELATYVTDSQTPLVAVVVGDDAEPSILRTQDRLYFSASLLPEVPDGAEWIALETDQESDERAFAALSRLGSYAPGLFFELTSPLDDVQDLEDEGRSSPYHGPNPADGTFTVDWSTEGGLVTAASISSERDGRQSSAELIATESPLEAIGPPPRDFVWFGDLPAGPLMASSLRLDDKCIGEYEEGVLDERECLARISVPVSEWLAERDRTMWYSDSSCW